MKKIDNEKHLQKMKNLLFEREEIVFVYLYGSMARGTANKLSDIDIAVYIDKNKKPESGSFGYRSELITELQSF
ncbi:MAG: nucleotidyltransferase domain-containing protein, partial [Candidatus Woesearchaeota archaeon]